MLSVFTYDTDGTTQRGITLLVENLRFSTNYPGGFGYCSFDLPGRRLGIEYGDIGYFYRVQVYNGLTLVWDGEIRVIEERQQRGQGISITAFGFGVLAGDDTYTRVLRDNRLGNWTDKLDDLLGSAGYKPEYFDTDRGARLYMSPKPDQATLINEFVAFRYELPKTITDADATSYVDESIDKVVYDWDVTFASGSWELLVRDVTNAANTSIAVATGSASAAATNMGAACKVVEFRLIDKAGNAARTTNRVDARLKRVTVWCKTTTITAGSTLAADLLAKDVLATKLDETGIGLSSTNTLVASASTRELNPAFFDDKDLTCREVLDWLCSFGDHNDKALAWAVWEDKVLQLEVKPTDAVYYRTHPFDAGDMSVSGSAEEMVLKAYAVVEATEGTTLEGNPVWQGRRRTADKTSGESANRYGSRYRRVPVPVAGIVVHNNEAAKARAVRDLFVADRDRPRVRSSFVLRRPVYDSGYGLVPLPEVRAGKVIEIPHLRAIEAEALGGNDLRDSSTIFLVASTEYDSESHTLTITPDGPRADLPRALARIEMAGMGR